MTIIAAIKENDKVYMGGDSAGVGGHYALTLRNDPKVFQVGHFIIGYTSSFRMGQLLRFGEYKCLRLDEFTEKEINDKEPFEFMVRDFIPRTRYLLKEGGYTTINSNTEEAGTFLVAWKNNLFRVDSDLQVGEAKDEYDACGCAENTAIGALAVLKELELPAEEKIRKALEIAEHHSGGVRGPFVILNT